MSKLIVRILISAFLLSVASCSSVTKKSAEHPNKVGKVLIASGYNKLLDNSRQNQHNAELTAKLNAYRDLAKQLYSEKLDNQATIAEQVINNELFRVYLDLYLRQASVIESTQMHEQKKVVVKLNLTPRFYHCISSTVQIVSQCLKQDNKTPFTRVGYKQVPVSTVNLACATPDCMGNISVSGFSKEKSSFNKTLLDYGVYDTEWSINVALRSALRFFILTEF